MLIITRKAGEKFFIGDDIEVQLVAIQGGQARIGIEAPKNIPIAREEIRHKFDKNGKKAVNVADKPSVNGNR